MGLKIEANAEVPSTCILSNDHLGGNSTGCKKKSDCIEVYVKMSLLLT